MGLHRDGSRFPNLAPFEAEMRRRTWWQICLNDARHGDCTLSEATLREDTFDVRIPSHTNDVDMAHDMIALPDSSLKFTDSTILALTCQLWRFGRRFKRLMQVNPPPEKLENTRVERLQWLDEARSQFAEEWSKRMIAGNPLHVFVRRKLSLQLEEVRLAIGMSYRSGAESCVDTRVNLVALAMACLETTLVLKFHPDMQKWSWACRKYVCWHGLSAALMELPKLPWGPTCEKAWKLCQREVESLPDYKSETPVLRPITGLMANVSKYREEEIRRLQDDPPRLQQLGQTSASYLADNGLEYADNEQLVFDISETKRRLKLERDISLGIQFHATGQECRGEQQSNADLDVTWHRLSLSAIDVDSMLSESTGSGQEWNFPTKVPLDVRLPDFGDLSINGSVSNGASSFDLPHDIESIEWLL
ncbi:Bikaverin cluster transcription factor bik5 [Paramyrothecium foliicola]|nr:Bikaverin cluster transcription factor bik5 [Paramyrothecium foliicola]